MSPHAESWALKLCEQHEELRPVHCHILQLLAIRHAHDYQMAWPSVAGMAAESHYTERAIYTALDELVKLGLLHRDYGELPRRTQRDRLKHGNRYRFPGLDTIPADEQPRLKGGRKGHADERASAEPDDVQMNGQMNGADERSVTTRSQGDEPHTHVTPEPAIRNGHTKARGRASGVVDLREHTNGACAVAGRPRSTYDPPALEVGP